MQINDVKQLLDWYQDYRDDQGNEAPLDRQAFAKWLLRKGEQPAWNPQNDGLIGMFLGLMYNYAIFYSRRVFKQSVIYSINDFGFLAVLMRGEAKTKSQLIQENIMEKSSGMEVIRRLLRQGLIEEADNPLDRRTKLVQIAPAGREAFVAIEAQMTQFGQVITGELAVSEKMTLLGTLQELHLFHWDLFSGKKEEEIVALLQPA